MLILNVGVSPGTEFDEARADASRLAFRLGLDRVDFKFNDDNCSAYPDGRTIVLSAGRYKKLPPVEEMMTAPEG